MPVGVSWPRYITFVSAALMSMFAGSQAVHLYYKPLEDLNRLIEEELEKQSKKEAGT